MVILGALILGWGCGLLVNYLSDILPLARKLTAPVCLNCSTPFSWGDYLLFKTCHSCGHKRSLRTWIVQAFFVIAIIWIAVSPPFLPGFWLGALLLTYFGLVAVIDLEYKAILLPTTYFGVLLGLVGGIVIHGVVDTLVGGAAGLLIMFGLYKFGEVFVKVLGKIRHQEIDEVALGEGDVYLMGVLGLMVGWPYVIGGLVFSMLAAGLVSGLIVVVSLILRKYQALVAIPYAPFLLFGAWVMLFIPKTLN
jgi:prepilin signal peptidase PulO-like enzyme (type II secretory pathway)